MLPFGAGRSDWHLGLGLAFRTTAENPHQRLIECRLRQKIHSNLAPPANSHRPPKTTALRPVPRFGSYFDTA